MEINENTVKTDAYAALRLPEFRSFLFARFTLTLGIQMQSVVVAWQVYEITHDALKLGLIGLAEAIPFIAVALFAGYWADRYPRKKIIVSMVFVYWLATIFLFALSTKLSWMIGAWGITPIFVVIGITGFVRASIYPAYTAFVAQLVPRHLYSNSATWNSTGWHIASITGPALGGLLYGFAGRSYAYLAVVLLVMTSMILFFWIKNKPIANIKPSEGLFLSLKEGIRFVYKSQVLLASMSLDMFAVLFGGAVAMLPIFADQILHTGPEGLGILRAAPAVGAVLMAFVLAYFPPLKRAGYNLMAAITLFGIATILFALSENFILTIFLLALTGMFDNVSVIIRQTIMQLYTPDEMRGRVASINSIFIGSSNEIGSFESGLAAKLMGLVPSVILGGGLTIFFVGIIGKISPKLRVLNLHKEMNKKRS